MVQEKNAAQKRKNWFREYAERIDRENPVVATKWSVEEVTPGYNTGGYYDQDIPEKFVKVSDYFETREEAEAWLDRHEADKGKFLAIRKHVAREMRHINWVSVRIRN